MDDVIAGDGRRGSSAPRSPGRSRAADGGAVRRDHPDRVSALVLYATFARATWAPGYEFAWRAEERKAHMDYLVEHWGEGLVAAAWRPADGDDPEFMEATARAAGGEPSTIGGSST